LNAPLLGKEMLKPNLDRTWEIWILLDKPTTYDTIVKAIRSQVFEVVSILKSKQIIDWYQFLIHPRNGEPAIHIRISLREGVDSKDFLSSLPNYCLPPKQIERKEMESISGIDKPLLKNQEIEEAWRILGEQSEWIIRMIDIYQSEKIPIQNFTQFMHFYLNMMGLGMQGILFLSPFINF
jgi:hypothetical protein